MAKIIDSKQLILEMVFEYVDRGLAYDKFNVFGIRNDGKMDQGIWNDTLGFWIEDIIFLAQGTTDPSPYYIVYHPMNPFGTAIMVPGFHANIWCIDGHGKTQYTALCNRREKGCSKQRIWRLDKEYQHVLNEDGSVRVFEGYFCCNFHRGDKFNPVPKISYNGGGCQVIQDPNDFNKFMEYVLKVNPQLISYMLFEDHEDITRKLGIAA